MIHPFAWVGWLAAVLATLSAGRNPLHLALVLLCIAVVDAATLPGTDRRTAPIAPLRFALSVTAISAALNALSVRYGDTVLLRLPGWLPLLGGAVTLEALAFGALSGLTLAGLFAAFMVAQRALPTSALVGLIPRAFYPLAVVAAIAITFVPATLRQARQIREAQAIRGHRLQQLRDWLPLLLPLLIGGLERAFQLAEAMAARGFAGAGRPQHATALRTAMVAGLAALLAGWLLMLAWNQPQAGQLLMLCGGGLLVGTLWRVGRRAPRTRYRRTSWAGADTAVLIGAAVAIVAFTLPLPGIDRAVLAYYPYPLLQLPRFDPVLGFATLGLAWPAAALRSQSRAYEI
jgi:energy-coupling factor transport system permease protein